MQVGEEFPVICEVVRDVVGLEVVLYLLVGAVSTFEQGDPLD